MEFFISSKMLRFKYIYFLVPVLGDLGLDFLCDINIYSHIMKKVKFIAGEIIYIENVMLYMNCMYILR